MNIPLWFFPTAVAVLQTAAAVNYFAHGSHRIALVWLGVSISNAALAGVKP